MWAYHIQIAAKTNKQTKRKILKEGRGREKPFPTEEQGYFCQKSCKQEESGVNYLTLSEEKAHYPGILHAVKLSFKCEGEIKCF